MELERVSFLMMPRRPPDAGGAPPASDAILMEDGTDILLENGDTLDME